MIFKYLKFTKDYKYKIHYIHVYFLFFGFRRIKIPYWISKSGLTGKHIKALDDIMRKLKAE